MNLKPEQNLVELGLTELVSARDALLQTNPESSKIDDFRNEIIDYIKEWRNSLPVELIIESLCSLGAAPSILYDDNGHFTIGGDGSQNLPTFEVGWETRETVFEGVWYVAPGHWKKTIREALNLYIDNL